MAAEREIVVEVPEGSAGFKCDEQLVITRIDAGGRCEAAGVQMGWVVTAFQDERFAPSFTWTQLKGLAKTTPKPWNFAFGPHASGAVAAVRPLLDSGKRRQCQRPRRAGLLSCL
jgi:hypothetical protein